MTDQNRTASEVCTDCERKYQPDNDTCSTRCQRCRCAYVRAWLTSPEGIAATGRARPRLSKTFSRL